MAIKYTIKVEGLDKLKKAIAVAPQKTAEQLNLAIQKSIFTVQSNVIKNAPVNKGPGGGNLRQNIRATMLGAMRGKVESKADYSTYVEAGTRPHIIKIKNKKVLAASARRSNGVPNSAGYVVFGKQVNHPGTRPTWFFKKGLENSQNTIEEHFQKAIEAVANFLAGK